MGSEIMSTMDCLILYGYSVNDLCIQNNVSTEYFPFYIQVLLE